MDIDRIPSGTITGAHGETALADGVSFTPTSRNGDGSVFLDGSFVGTVYADKSFPIPPGKSYDAPRKAVYAFTALTPGHATIGTYPTQQEAIAALARRPSA